MTGMELSTIVRRRLPVIVIVLDNGGYGTERLLHPGQFKFNDIHPWQYSKLPEILGGGTGYCVGTEAEFDAALTAAWQDRTGASVLHVRLDPQDCSRALAKLAEMMQKTVVGSTP
jgi:indolepyruvate decarboxylase